MVFGFFEIVGGGAVLAKYKTMGVKKAYYSQEMACFHSNGSEDLYLGSKTKLTMCLNAFCIPDADFGSNFTGNEILP